MYSVLSWLFFTLALLVWTLPAGVAPVAREEEPKVVVDTKVENADSVVIQGRQCSFFGDSRLSQAESSLINCSWYKSDSCCKRTEVTSVFSGMMSLKDASRHCRNLMHYMMCYFCSPFQGDWYRTRVIVCKRFCEAVYDHCRSATYQGQSLESQYSSGVDFCEQGQNFQDHVVRKWKVDSGQEHMVDGGWAQRRAGRSSGGNRISGGVRWTRRAARPLTPDLI